MYVIAFIYTVHINKQYTQLLCKHKLLFWMQFDSTT